LCEPKHLSGAIHKNRAPAQHLARRGQISEPCRKDDQDWRRTRDPKDFSQLIGFDADLARAVFDCAGVKYEFFLGAGPVCCRQ
jgi:hypothetical protein